MIAGTNADCRILDVSVSGDDAIVTALVFAASSTYPPKSFALAIQDDGSETRQYPTNEVYWVDRNNNYDNDSRNVDTNKYRKIVFSIDISDGGKAGMDGTKWVRKCYVQLIDQSKPFDSVAWSSGMLTLVSEPFDIPDILNLNAAEGPRQTDGSGKKTAKIAISFKLRYKQNRNFAHNLGNAKALVRVKSPSTGMTLEEFDAPISDSAKCRVVTNGYYEYGTPVLVEANVANLKNEVMSSDSLHYKLTKNRSDAFVKTRDGVRKAVWIFVKADSGETVEEAWI